MNNIDSDLSYSVLTSEYKDNSWIYTIVSSLREILFITFAVLTFVSFIIIYPCTSLIFYYFSSYVDTQPSDNISIINHATKFSTIILLLSMIEYTLIMIVIIEQVMLHRYKKYKYIKTLRDLKYGSRV